MSTNFIFDVETPTDLYKLENNKPALNYELIRELAKNICFKYNIMYHEGIFYITDNNKTFFQIDDENSKVKLGIKQHFTDKKIVKILYDEIKLNAENNALSYSQSRILHYSNFEIIEPTQNKEYIYFLNKKVNIRTGFIEDYTKQDIVFMQIPYNVLENQITHTPNLDKVINTYFPNYEIEVIKDLLTYTIISGNPAKAFIILYGQGNAGKTSIINNFILRLLERSDNTRKELTHNNYAKSKFSALADDKTRFNNYSYVNKLLVWCDEASPDDLKNTTNAIKDLTSGEKSTIVYELKGLNKTRQSPNYFKPILSTNYLPELKIDDDAYYNRTFIYECIAKLEYSENLNLLCENIEWEIFIYNYVIPRLKEWQGHFKLKGQVHSKQEKKELYENYSNPFIKAIKTHFEFGDNERVAFKDVITFLEQNDAVIRHLNSQKHVAHNNANTKIKDAFNKIGYNVNEVVINNTRLQSEGRTTQYTLKPKSELAIQFFKEISNASEWTREHYGKIGQDVLLNANETQLNTTTYNDIRNYFKTSSDATILRSVLITEFKQHSTKDIDLVLSTLVSQGEIIEHKLYEYKINLLRGGTQK
jgi:hypothetical protein